MVGAVLVLCLLAGSCGGDDDQDGANEPARGQRTAERVKLKVGIGPFISNAPFYIAQEEGYFDEQGLDVELVVSPSSAQNLALLVSRDVDVFAGAVVTGVINAISSGTHLRVVADKGLIRADSCSYTNLVKGTPVASRIQAPADLRGRTVAYPAENISLGYMVAKTLEQGGLQLDDIKVIDVDEPAVSDALAKGSIDLALLSEPWITRVVDAGAGTPVFPAQEFVPDFQFGVTIFGPSILDGNREAGRRFMVAYLKAVRQYMEGKTPRNVRLLSEFTRLEPELVKRMCLPVMTTNGRVNLESLLDLQKWANQQGLIDETVPADELWDPTFVNHANRQLSSR